MLGDWVSYSIGHHYKEHALAIWPISRFPEQMEKALAFFRRWGIWAIFIGRFTGPLRATVPIVAGISQMTFWPFQISNVSSALLWSAVLIALGAVGTAAMGPLGHGLPRDLRIGAIKASVPRGWGRSGRCRRVSRFA